MQDVVERGNDNMRMLYMTKLSTFQIIFFLTLSSDLRAEEYFNPAALELNDNERESVNLTLLSQNDGQLPGRYRVGVNVNGTLITSQDINFILVDNQLRPELTLTDLQHYGVNVDAFAALKSLEADQTITDIARYIPDANTQFDFKRQQLNVSIPQAALNTTSRDYIDPTEWDQGVPALLLNYSASAANAVNKNTSDSNNSSFLNLRSGANWGSWRLRNYSTWSKNNDSQRWNNISTYLQRDIQFLKSQLIAGDSFTPSDIFDSVPFRGVQLVSDDNMYPDSQRGFAPVVRGIAQSNAQVSVRQNGYVIYQTYVAPGAFEITDLYPTSTSGDLEVIIKEADGTERVSVQPYSAVPIMLREGRVKYGITSGTFRSNASLAREPVFTQGSVIYGLPHATSVYAGVIASSSYLAGMIGVGHGFGDWGSLSFDITQAETQLQGARDKKNGQSFRVQYSKDINDLGTNFTLASYRYSTKGFYDFKESNEINVDVEGESISAYNNKRSRTQVNINQRIAEVGNIFISGLQQDYWGHNGYERSVNIGWNASFNDVTYGLSYGFNQSPLSQGTEQLIAFNIQVPLSKWLPKSRVSYSVDTSNRGRTSQRVGISGTALEQNNLNYDLQQSYANQGTGYGGNASVNYRGTYGQVNAGYNYSRDTRRMNVGAQGGVVAHPWGVTLSQPLGDTVVLVRAPHADRVALQNQTGVNTDWRGYAVVPYATSYRKNRIALDPTTFKESVDIDTTVATAIPTQGAVVVANFATRVGNRSLITITKDGRPVPFGAAVTYQADQDNLVNSIAGTHGETYLAGIPEKGVLLVKWGEQPQQQCRAAFTVQVKPGQPIQYGQAVCG
jgi:outer membrane usher protein